MGRIQDGTVYLCLDVDVFDEEASVARWNGHCEYRDGSKSEIGPEFLDASDAVTWWRERGATHIYIRLDFREYLWAGEGLPPDEWSTISVFDPADPRCRPDGAAKTADAERGHFAEVVSARRLATALDEGCLLKRRREEVHLSISELADRVGQSEQWVLDAESGKLSGEETFAQWIELVWATRPGWPKEMRTNNGEGASWVAARGQYLREAEVFVNQMLGLYD